MAHNEQAERLAELIRTLGRVDAPAVTPLEPEIRSGDKFLLRDPTLAVGGVQDKRDPGRRKRVEDRLKSGRVVGGLVIEWGYDVAEDDVAEFLAFLGAAEDTLLQKAPKGVRYRGTYAVFSSTEKNMGDFRTVWGFDSFDDLQQLSAELEADAVSEWADAVLRLRRFMSRAPGTGRSQQIYQLAAGVSATPRGRKP